MKVLAMPTKDSQPIMEVHLHRSHIICHHITSSPSLEAAVPLTIRKEVAVAAAVGAPPFSINEMPYNIYL